MAEKVTIMVLKVDLQCPCCYKKVKKILCKFPQIRDQIFNEKANTVTITVVCCDPEKFRDKLCCKGAPVIKSIEIKEPEPPPPPKEKPPPPPKEKPPPPPKEKPPPPPKEKPPPPPIEKPPPPPKEKPPPPPPAPVPTPCPCPPAFPVRTCCGPCSEGYGGGPCYFGFGVAPPPPPEKRKDPPARTCCGPCSEGYDGGPCYFGFGVAPPPPPQPCFEGYYGYGCHERPRHVTRCDYYFNEENPQACSIM